MYSGNGSERSLKARISLTTEDPDDLLVAEVFRRFQDENRPPIALYRALAHSPRILSAYGQLAAGLRYDAAVDRRLRELVILRIAQLTESEYEWAHHVPLAQHAGIEYEEIRALADWHTSLLFSERERSVLQVAEEVHKASVTDAAFETLWSLLSSEEAVEIIVVAAFYEAVARIVQALGIEVEPPYEKYRDGGRSGHATSSGS